MPNAVAVNPQVSTKSGQLQPFLGFGVERVFTLGAPLLVLQPRIGGHLLLATREVRKVHEDSRVATLGSKFVVTQRLTDCVAAAVEM